MNGNTVLVGHAATAWDYGPGTMDASWVFLPDAPVKAIESAQVQDGVKRCVDLALSLLGIVVTLPLWIPIALTVKLTSRGPVFFTQKRAGLNGRPFRMFKFRSMVVDAEARL